MDKGEIKRRLDCCNPCCIEDDRFIPSAVLLPLFEKNGEWHVLLTLRSANLPTHQNQISFPGGALDQGESPVEAALRETHEEMGIKPDDVEVLGTLDEIVTITKYRITPFVGIIPHPYKYCVCEAEIAEVIEMPLSKLCEHEVYREENKIIFGGKPYPVYYFNCGRHVVWGATARILKQFLEVAMGWSAPACRHNG